MRPRTSTTVSPSAITAAGSGIAKKGNSSAPATTRLAIRTTVTTCRANSIRVSQPSRMSTISAMPNVLWRFWTISATPASVVPSTSVSSYPATAANATAHTTPDTVSTRRRPTTARTTRSRSESLATASSRTPTAVSPKSVRPWTVATRASTVT